MKSIYLDPSIPSACCEKAQPERRKITTQWWNEQINQYEVAVSRLTIEEIEALETEDKREAILSLVRDFPVLEVSPPVERLAERYIEEKIIPPNAFNDALHLALAVINKKDVLLSWNFAHLVKSEVERKVNAYNLISGYPRIRITTPQKLIKEE
ncbi:PIN domain-containing protein [Candidatus Aerophobetes bacterium]|uniref:PIN domain-containing protein n=1 Tax=Aerophobetes bacterium TaxID=2030807 RepID=A0A523S137_UNCAE|nr:MAG: PIN domain-containing protein [Candidatus Aerophobetes bacterium]